MGTEFGPGEEDLNFEWDTSDDRIQKVRQSSIAETKRLSLLDKIPAQYRLAVVSALTAAAVTAGTGVAAYSYSHEAIKAGQTQVDKENHERGQQEIINNLTAEDVPSDVIEWAVDFYNDPDYQKFVKENKVLEPEDFVQFLARRAVVTEDEYPGQETKMQEEYQEYQAPQIES